jgi:hypothetical protein
MRERSRPERQEARERMGPQIAEQQHELEKDHRHRPHGGRTAEAGQDHFREHGLHGEQQQRGKQKRAGEGRQHGARAKARQAIS